MLKITLRETYDEPDPPSRSFNVMEARGVLGTEDLLVWRDAEVEVSIEQLQAIIIGLWRLLPPDARPVPGWPQR